MSRETFLNTLQHFDENYNVITKGDNDFAKRLDGKYDLEKVKYNQFRSHIDIARVRQLALTVDDSGKYNSCFARFYDLDDDLLFSFFGQLSNTELGLLYIDDFADNYRDNQTRNRNKVLQKKIDSVLEYAEAVGTCETTIEDIKFLRNSLDNQHLTKHKLFENLLFCVSILFNANAKNSYIVANTTNAIIKDYFGIEDITFSRYAKIENYIGITYTYYDAKGITLHHA